jgi:galactitol-specific phosphotransferase system IIB component
MTQPLRTRRDYGKQGSLPSFIELENMHPDDQHHLRKTCAVCGGVETCRCSTPKTDVVGICYDCGQKENSIVASVARKALYWCSSPRTYRLSKPEQETGKMVCPRCHKTMRTERFTRNEKLHTCRSCGFKVPSSSVVKQKVNIEMTDDGIEIEVESENTKAGKGNTQMSKVASELTRIAKLVRASIKVRSFKDSKGKRWVFDDGDFIGHIVEQEESFGKLYRVTITFPNADSFQYKRLLPDFGDAKKELVSLMRALQNENTSVVMTDWRPY